MRKILLIGAAAALAVPGLAAADPPSGSPGPNPRSPAAQCRAELAAMGETNFRNTYGTNPNKSNAFGKCVSRHAGRQDTNADNASRRCRAERDDPNFAAAHGGQTFAQFYGTNRNDRNAFGKCVSSKTRAATAQQQQAALNAARACRAEQRQDPAAFRNRYGTNRNKSNAFGKCVSARVRA
jgi:hypothetical protein